jgi:FKBP-type peptidyl-prolyl cis-trans isomerase
LTDGNRFDANENKENPFKFTIGVGQVIKGKQKIKQKNTFIRKI